MFSTTFGAISLLLLVLLFRHTVCDLVGSNFLGALSSYGYDMCRYISCPFGQLCTNGVCIPGTNTFDMNPINEYPLYGPNPFSTSFVDRTPLSVGYPSTKFCTINPDCYLGQMCIYGRCVSGSNTLPFGGTRQCNSIQQCLNGQICVNGFCTQSNVAYSGNPAQIFPTSCSTGAVCPIGQYCINGICTLNSVTTTFACGNGNCPTGTPCRIGRCLNLRYLDRQIGNPQLPQ